MGANFFHPFARRENGRRVRKAVDALGIEDPWLMPLAASDDDLDVVFAKVGADLAVLMLVHSIAFADKDYLKSVHRDPARCLHAAATSPRSPNCHEDRRKPPMTNGGSILSLSTTVLSERPGIQRHGGAKAALVRDSVLGG